MTKSSSEDQPLLPTTSKDTSDVSSQSHALLGMTCVALLAFSFSLTTTAVKFLTYSMTSTEAIFWRSIVAICLNLDVYHVLSQMVLADSSSIVFSSPVFTFFLGACLLHEHIDRLSFACAILSFSGLLCIVSPNFIFGANHATVDTDGPWIAIGSAFLRAIGQAFVYISVRKLKGIHFMVVVHYFLLSSMIRSLSYVLVVQQKFVMPATLAIWSGVLCSGVFTFFGGADFSREHNRLVSEYSTN